MKVVADQQTLALGAAAVSAGLAVLTLLLALAARPGEAGWGGGLVGRLERLAAPAWRERTRGAGAGPGPGRGPGEPPLGWVAGVAIGTLGALAGRLLLGGPVPTALAAAGAVWAWRAGRSRARRVFRTRFQEGLEGALESMVASLRAGQGLVQAIQEAERQASGPVRAALAGVVARYQAGTPLTEALAEMAETWSLPEVSYLGACLGTHARTGGDVCALLLNLGGLVRERRTLARELAGRTGEARSTAALLALLPIGLLAYVVWVEPAQFDPLLASPAGLAALAYAAASWAAGVVVVRRMISGVTREIEEER